MARRGFLLKEVGVFDAAAESASYCELTRCVVKIGYSSFDVTR